MRLSISLRKLVAIGGLLVIKVFVCVAHYSDSFLLWDIRVKASDIH